MVSNEDVREQTRRILGEANLDETSGKLIRVKVREVLELTKEQISSFRPLIEKEIADFLDQHEAGPLQATPASAKSSLGREHPTSDDRPAKQRKISPEGAPEFELSDNRKISVREFKGKQLIDIREFYEKDGEQKPGSKGLALSREQWQKLLTGLPSLLKAVEAEEVGFSVDLGSKRLASVSSFKGSLGVDFREHYEKDGNLAPGKRGILLPLEQWETLCSIASEITSAAGSLPPRSPVQSPVKDSPGGKAGSGTEKQKATPGSADVDADFVDLGKLRRASVSEFKGRKLLNVREYYEKDGEAKPGKKGISLTKDQAEALLSKLDDLSGALSQQQEVSIGLGPKRYAKVNKFKNSYLVDIREYYEKDGEEKPGAKGISLTADQWNILAPKLKGLVSSL